MTQRQRREHKRLGRVQSAVACEWCGVAILTTGKIKFCSTDCRRARHLIEGRSRWATNHPAQIARCRRCGEAFVATRERKTYCHNPCVRAQTWRRKDDIDSLYVFQRDGWRCHLCGKLALPKGAYPDPMSASVDHIVPVSAGGSNDPRNLATAHLRCNIRRGAGGVVQLRLIA